MVATIAELERCRNIDTIHSPPPTPQPTTTTTRPTTTAHRGGGEQVKIPLRLAERRGDGVEFISDVCIDVVLRLMFLCNVNNVQPSSWTRVEDRQARLPPPPLPVSASDRE